PCAQIVRLPGHMLGYVSPDTPCTRPVAPRVRDPLRLPAHIPRRGWKNIICRRAHRTGRGFFPVGWPYFLFAHISRPDRPPGTFYLLPGHTHTSVRQCHTTRTTIHNILSRRSLPIWRYTYHEPAQNLNSNVLQLISFPISCYFVSSCTTDRQAS